MKKIHPNQTRIFDEQLAEAWLFAQERIQSILATEPIDESVAEGHLREAYKAAGLEPPATIRWFDSPLGFCLARSMASVGDSVRASVWASVWASVRDSVRASVWASVRDSVRASVGASVWASVGALWDQDDCAFLWYWHVAFRPNPFIHFAMMNEMAHGYFLGKNEAWLVRKASRLQRDERGRLHSSDGMAIRYRDGWGFYAWHGVRTSEQIIMRPETLTKENWLNERNLELRRVIQERLNGEQFIKLVGAHTLHRDECGELVEVDLGDDPERIARYVHVQDTSTERKYYLRVPPAIERARQGIAWTFDIPEAEYCPLQEA